MIWILNSSSMEKPNMDVQKQAMGFRTSTTYVLDILKKTRRQILGQVMGLNCFTWVFSLALVEQTCLA